MGQSNSKHRFGLSELLAYLTGWVVLCSAIAGHQMLVGYILVSQFVMLLLPGFLISGAIGFLIVGRPLFMPAALFGASIWLSLVGSLVFAFNLLA